MLASELYQINKDSSSNIVHTQFPIKKIFYKNNQIIIDKKTLEEYGSSQKETSPLENALQMPLNTINAKNLNLPDHRTGKAASNPYIEVYGALQTNLKLESKINVSIGKKQDTIVHELDLTNGEITKSENGKPKLKLDKIKYFVNTKNLFDEYVNSGIIDKNGMLNTKKYNDIIEKFLEFTKKQDLKITKRNGTKFRIYILPNDATIEYKELQKNTSKKNSFIDYLGNTVTDYSSTPTKTTKFLTYDDPAFTINCKKEKEFYKNLGIGEESKEKIYVDPDRTFQISQLHWTFVDISNLDSKFVKTNKGILTQLYENYEKLSKDKGMIAKTSLKIICRRINQAKQEILIDENLTMDRMKSMFENITNIPNVCFEVFIDKSTKNPIWSTYIYVIKNFLAGNKIPKNYLVSYFTKIVKQNQHKWKNDKNKLEATDFFKKANFCLKDLFNSDKTADIMTKMSEEFAEKIGQISRLYVDFKKTNSDGDNSLSDILTYSKYDRERLRFIVSRIGRGVQLSKIAEEKKKDLTNKITTLQPKEEINDDVASNDFSYFFFKGYYTKEDTT